ncbi:MAG: alpha/beta hydrolase [Spirochaetes bacterium]|nr:MAG: alpha/beta hydrolase [Spirochaetota bacterium]
MNKKFIEEEVTILTPIKIRGTISFPEEIKISPAGEPHKNAQCPAILFIGGSGEVDRNENHRKVKINTFKLLAEVINDAGLAVLRYDKRGVGESEGNYLETGFWDFVFDAEKVLTFLKSYHGINPDKIYILGHSEGAILAAVVNQKNPVHGLILISGVAESLRQTIKRQSEMALWELSNTGGLKGFLFRVLNLKEKAQKRIEKLHNKILDSNAAVMRVGFKKINAKWMREHFLYNVEEALKCVTCPTLVIAGDKDIQTPPEQAKTIAELVKGKVQWHIIEDMNHILREERGKPSILSAFKRYREQEAEPLHHELVELLKSWLMEEAKNE